VSSSTFAADAGAEYAGDIRGLRRFAVLLDATCVSRGPRINDHKRVDVQEPKQTGDQESRAALARVFGRGSIYTLATVVQLGAGILTIPILTRIVTPEQYGEITAALVVQAVLATIATFGSPAAISRTYFRRAGPEGARALVAAVAGVALLITLLAELTGPLWAGLSYDWILRLAAFSA
jgi:hypothetical protein